MSRYSGCWVAFKCVTDVVESGASVDRSTRNACTIEDPDRLHPAAGRPEHPLARRHPRAGSAPARLEGLRRARLRARQRPRSHRLGFAPTRDWASSPPASPSATPCRRSPISASTKSAARDIGLRVYKVAMSLAARAAGRAALRRGPGRDPGGRGKAPADRVPDQGRALQLEAKACARRAWSASSTTTANGAAPRASPPAPGCCPRTTSTRRRSSRGRSPAPCEARHGSQLWASQFRERLAFLDFKEKALAKPRVTTDPPALLLLRLPAQHLHARARGQPRHRRHRLPLHGGVDGPQHRDLHAHGRARARRGSARRRSRTRSTSSPTSATAPTSTPGCSRSAPRWRPRSA